MTLPRPRPTPDRNPSGVRSPSTALADRLEAVVKGVATEPVESAVHGVLASALLYVPLSFAVRLGEPWGTKVVLCAPGLELAGDLAVGVDARVFPQRAWERARTLEGGSAVLTLAGDEGDPSDHAALEDELAEQLDAVLSAARTREALRRTEGELATLRAQLLHGDRLAALGQLSASIVHELNNPLTTVLAYSDHVARRAEAGPLGPADVERLRRVTEAASRLQDFVRRLAGWARPGESEVGMLQIEEAVERALSFCEHAVERAGATVVRRFGSTAPVFGSARELTQVFVNLVTNAAQSMTAGGVIEVVSRAEVGFTVVEVLDEGPGIHPAHLPHIFDPFFTTKGPDVGTGLGLNIVRRVVESHGGEVRADTRVTGGAVFSIRLPAEPPSPPILSTTPPPASEPRLKKR